MEVSKPSGEKLVVNNGWLFVDDRTRDMLVAANTLLIELSGRRDMSSMGSLGVDRVVGYLYRMLNGFPEDE